MEPNHVTDSKKSENSERRSAKMGHTGLNLNSAKDRWGKLKTTVAVTNQITTKKSRRLDRGDSFLRKFSTRNQAAEVDLSVESEDSHRSAYRHSRHKTLKSFVIHPSGGLMFYWLGLVTLSVLYNLWTCIAREAFREIQKGYMVMWFCLDAACDCIYLCDIFVQFRTGYLQQGLMVYDSSKLCRNYLKDKCFIVDLSSLLPLDFIQFYTGIHPMLRFPRFLKLYRSVRFMHMYESRTAYPNLLRVASLSHILFLGSHWFAAFYYLISEAEGFEGDWSYPKPVGHYAAVTRKYLASLYWSTLTLTTIGDLPPPDTNWQYVFVIVSYLIGVFIFATIVGQVGNVITNRNASRQEFERLLDGAKFYMQMHNVPPDLQKRVQRWYDYVWTRGRLNCNDINSLGLLPDKLKTELALHVNLGTLKKDTLMPPYNKVREENKILRSVLNSHVTIFQKCRPEFLHDLMLKMRAYIFTPGDLICRRGEVAREMFIIADGVVEILGENGTVLTQMSTGDFFGEIGILNLDGGINRRTADVRSVGYSELFVLSREDVLAALKDHPDAEQIIREYGQRRLKETEEHRKMVRSTPSSPDPSSFRGSKGTNKVNTESTGQGVIHLPQVKCLQNLQKLPHMSPKLRKLFSLRNKRSKRRDCRRNSDSTENDSLTVPSRDVSKQDTVTLEKNLPNKNDNGVKLPVANLDIIQEKDQSDTEQDQTQEQLKSNTSGNTNLADLVLNLIKTRRQLGYRAVRSEETDADEQFEDEPSGEIKDTATGKCTSSKVNYAYNDKNEDYTNNASENRHHHRLLKRENAIDTRYDKKGSISAPKIILTHDTDQTSSESSSSESEKEDVTVERTPTPFLPIRNHISRKSSPCILPIPSTLNDGTGRKYSCAPPLDLPIEVPSFSNFRGLSGSTQEISFSLDRFRSQIMERMDNMESSNRETQIRLQETLMLQEKIMKNILKRLPSKDKSKDEVVNAASDTTNVNSDALRTSSGKGSAFAAYTTHALDSGEISIISSEPIYSNNSGQSACSNSNVLTNSCAVPDCSEILNKPTQLGNNEMVDTSTETLGKSGNSVKQHPTSREDSNENKKTMNKSIELFEDGSIFKLVTEHGEENIEYKVTHL